jgi:midasin
VKCWAEEWSQRENICNTLLSPLLKWFPSLPDRLQNPQAPLNSPHSEEKSPLLNSLLVILQLMMTLKNEWSAGGFQEPGLKDGHITTSHQFILKTHQTLRLELLLSELVEMTQNMEGDAGASVSASLITCSPYLETFLFLAESILKHHTCWLGAVLKLTHVLGCILRNLGHRGFCRPENQEKDATGSEDHQQQSGTGFGDGHGEQGISESIPDESQLEGLQNQESGEHHEEGTGDGLKNAVEMEMEYGGELYDHESNVDPESSSENEAEDRVEEIDPKDPKAVDEKLWGEHADNDDKSSYKEGAGKSSMKDGGSSELTNKSNDEQEPKPDPDENSEQQEELNLNEEPPVEAGIQGAQDTHLPESEILDIPEELTLSNEVDIDVPEDIEQETANEGSLAGESQGEDMDLADTFVPLDSQMDVDWQPEESVDVTSADLGGQGSGGDFDHNASHAPENASDMTKPSDVASTNQTNQDHAPSSESNQSGNEQGQPGFNSEDMSQSPRGKCVFENKIH